jgi:hypothetical protein
VISGDVRVQQLCTQTSREPVAVAFKRTSVTSLFGDFNEKIPSAVMNAPTFSNKVPNKTSKPTVSPEVCIARKHGFLVGTARIKIDRELVMKLNYGQVGCVTTTVGRHNIHAKGGGISGNINVDIASNESKKLDLEFELDWTGMGGTIVFYEISYADFQKRYSDLPVFQF